MLSYNPRNTIIFYTLVLMGLFCVPSYFAIKSTITEQRYKTTQEIQEWVMLHQDAIFEKDEFKVPSSVRFHINIYDFRGELLYKGIEKELTNINFKSEVSYPYLYYKQPVQKDDKLYFLVVELEQNHTKTLFISFVLFVVVLILFYIISYMFAHSSIYPYKKMQKYMSDFFNDSMHELKTPLGVIGVNIELMARFSQDSKHLQRIKAATKQMQMTYEDIEYYIKNKKLLYQKEDINLSEYLAQRIVFFEDIALPKRIEFVVHVEENLHVYINKTQLQRVIDNTISNAIKYSYFQGKVHISLEKADGKCRFSVEDFGIGIKDIYKVFRRFEREDLAQGGFGLGLNIVQNICNKNNININIESYENVGSKFSYMFELDKKKLLDVIENGK